MTRVLLVRHGRTTANADGVLAGRHDVELDDVGRGQAERLALKLQGVQLDRVVVSPLRRARDTANIIVAGRPLRLITDDGINECDYGTWTGRPLSDLRDDPLWDVVQRSPCSAVFPDGESMTEMSVRAVAAVRWHATDLAAEAGDADASHPSTGAHPRTAPQPSAAGGNSRQADPSAPRADSHAPAEPRHAPAQPRREPTVLVVTHGDIIKAIVADALGMHLDLFQRLVVHPGSLSIIGYSTTGTIVECVNDRGGDALDSPPVGEPTPGGQSGR